MQVTRHVHALKIPFQLPIAPGLMIDRFVYAYIIFGNGIYLIDCGVNASVPIIFDYVKKAGREPFDISSIFLTHSHPDHMGGAKAIADFTGCRIAAHAGEKAWIENTRHQFNERPVPGFDSLVGGPVRVDSVFEDGDVIQLEDGLTLEVIHTPGHSKGSISLFLREEGALFSGDAIPMPYDVPVYEDVPSLLRSIKRLQAVKGVQYLLSSWDPPKNVEDVHILMDESIEFVRLVDEVVKKHANDTPEADALELCRKVFIDLGLPVTAVSPLIAKTMSAHLSRH